MSKSYWGYRINTEVVDFFANELVKGNLRQGWGFDPGQNLKNRPLVVDQGANGNAAIYDKVKKGDVILVLRCPSWSEVSIVEATQDFDEGYQFSIDDTLKDYGHIFPVRRIKTFVRDNENVSGDLRSSMKTPSRFWNMNRYEKDIEKLIQSTDDLTTTKTKGLKYKHAVRGAFEAAFDSQKFSNAIYSKMENSFSNEEWEFALVEGLKSLLPSPIVVERTGGSDEQNHGCDIMIKYPGLLGKQYIVGIQVKDYSGKVSNYPIDQVSKIDEYFSDCCDCQVIDKIVIVINVDKQNNQGFDEYANEKNVRVIYLRDFKQLLADIAKSTLGIKSE